MTRGAYIPSLDLKTYTKIYNGFVGMIHNGYDFCFYCGGWLKKSKLDYTYVGGKCKECVEKQRNETQST